MCGGGGGGGQRINYTFYETHVREIAELMFGALKSCGLSG